MGFWDTFPWMQNIRWRDKQIARLQLELSQAEERIANLRGTAGESQAERHRLQSALQVMTTRLDALKEEAQEVREREATLKSKLLDLEARDAAVMKGGGPLFELAAARFLAPYLPPYAHAEQFRWAVLNGYGFQPWCREMLATFPLQVKDLQRPLGGGLAYHDHIELNGVSHEACLHEFIHKVWQRWAREHPEETVVYLRAWWTAKQASDATESLKAYWSEQFEGVPGFKGILWDGQHKVEIDSITPENVFQIGIDYDHAFTSLASWCMGKYVDGPRALPSSLHEIFNVFFTGTVLLQPYYEGGVL